MTTGGRRGGSIARYLKQMSTHVTAHRDGIADADRRRLFEPFFRGGDDAPRNRNGAGLGLAISRAIIEAHGGRIWLESSARGARVRFSLPQH